MQSLSTKKVSFFNPFSVSSYHESIKFYEPRKEQR